MPLNYVDETTWEETKYQEELYIQRAKNDRDWKQIQDSTFQTEFACFIAIALVFLFFGTLLLLERMRVGVFIHL